MRSSRTASAAFWSDRRRATRPRWRRPPVRAGRGPGNGRGGQTAHPHAFFVAEQRRTGAADVTAERGGHAWTMTPNGWNWRATFIKRALWLEVLRRAGADGAAGQRPGRRTPCAAASRFCSAAAARPRCALWPSFCAQAAGTSARRSAAKSAICPACSRPTTIRCAASCELYTACAHSADLLALWDVGAERQVIRGCQGTQFAKLRALSLITTPTRGARRWRQARAGRTPVPGYDPAPV